MAAGVVTADEGEATRHRKTAKQQFCRDELQLEEFNGVDESTSGIETEEEWYEENHQVIRDWWNYINCDQVQVWKSVMNVQRQPCKDSNE